MSAPRNVPEVARGEGAASGAPDVDEIAVERRCQGDRTVSLNRDEAQAAFERLERAGLSAAQTAARLGVSQRAVDRFRAGARPKSLPARAAS